MTTRNKPPTVWAVVTAEKGIPVSVEVFSQALAAERSCRVRHQRLNLEEDEAALFECAVR